MIGEKEAVSYRAGDDERDKMNEVASQAGSREAHGRYRGYFISPVNSEIEAGCSDGVAIRLDLNLQTEGLLKLGSR